MKLITRVLLMMVLTIALPALAQENYNQVSQELPDRVFAADIYIQRGFPTGDNFIGNGLSSGTGFGIRLQSDVYQNIYIGGALSQDYFDVKDEQVIGQFSKATKFNAYFFAGYDYVINDDWNITADIGYGYSQNKNKQSFSQGGGVFKDTGNLIRLTTSVEYALNNSISVYVSPSFENISYNIDAAPALGDRFEKGNYFNLALGFRFNARNYNSIPLSISENKRIQELQGANRDDLTIREKRDLYFLKKKEARKARRKRRNQN